MSGRPLDIALRISMVRVAPLLLVCLAQVALAARVAEDSTSLQSELDTKLSELSSLPSQDVPDGSNSLAETEQRNERPGPKHCNFLSSNEPKYYHFDVEMTGGFRAMLELIRTQELAILKAHYGSTWAVWQATEDNLETTEHLIWDARPDGGGYPARMTQLDLLHDIRYVRRLPLNGEGPSGYDLPDLFEIEDVHGRRRGFTGGAFYPEEDTEGALKYALSGDEIQPLQSELKRELVDQEGERRLSSIQLKGLPVRNLTLEGVSTSSVVIGAVGNLAGLELSVGEWATSVGMAAIGLSGFFDTLLSPTANVLSATYQIYRWFYTRRRLRYPASEKIFDKLFCHPGFKECPGARGNLLVPVNATCPELCEGEPVMRGTDGPADFAIVYKRHGEDSSCSDESMKHKNVTDSATFMRVALGANTSLDSQSPECFSLEQMPWDAELGRTGPQWYRLWCDPDSRAYGLQTYSDESCTSCSSRGTNIFRVQPNQCALDEGDGYFTTWCTPKHEHSELVPESTYLVQPSTVSLHPW